MNKQGIHIVYCDSNAEAVMFMSVGLSTHLSVQPKCFQYIVHETTAVVSRELGYIDSLVQGCSNSGVLAKELLQFETKPSI